MQRSRYDESVARFDDLGPITLDMSGGRFCGIVVSYNSITNTRLDGRVIEMDLPH